MLEIDSSVGVDSESERWTFDKIKSGWMTRTFDRNEQCMSEMGILQKEQWRSEIDLEVRMDNGEVI